MKISVIGCGYVGLVSAACFADAGHEVTCIDNDAEKLNMLKENQVPIFEPGLQELISKNKSLEFSLNISEDIASSKIIMIAVGTPSLDSGEADLTQLYRCVEEISHFISSGTLVIIKSTVPVGTCDEVEKLINDKSEHNDFEVISNPEFLREGNAIHDFVNPDRIVIGLNGESNKESIIELYSNIVSEDLSLIHI